VKKRDGIDFVEEQYQPLLDIVNQSGLTKLGIMTNQVWRDDPKRLTFVLSRYKFVSKMLDGCTDVLELGCGDAWASRIVRQTVRKLTVSDFDPIFVDLIKDGEEEPYPIEAIVHDMVVSPTKDAYDGIYAIDVLEHVALSDEDKFLSNIVSSLKHSGTVILGIPSLESQFYASPASKEGHVNCKTGNDFRDCLARYFHNVFIFSMNDEVVHTGFDKMAHYLFGMCCSPKASAD
jgi:cyclopropane fatty-acyl-phospholipid synthase-like methyltransferase